MSYGVQEGKNKMPRRRKVKRETMNGNVTIVKSKNCYPHGSWGGAYFLGFLGALIYYMQQASGFWSVILGILKACVWPVFVVYHLLGL